MRRCRVYYSVYGIDILERDLTLLFINLDKNKRTIEQTNSEQRSKENS